MSFFLLLLPTKKQEILSQSSEKLEHLIASSPASLAAKASAEQDAIAALQALRNNNNHTKPVTSVLSKTHLENLHANSVSVIPIESMKISHQQQQQQQHHQQPTIIHHQTIHLQQQQQQHQPKQQPLIQVKNLTQLQQEHLETAAVLMDISKKVIISPPSSNPQSPSLIAAEQQQQQQQKLQQQQHHQQQQHQQQYQTINNNNQSQLQSIKSSVIKVS